MQDNWGQFQESKGTESNPFCSSFQQLYYVQSFSVIVIFLISHIWRNSAGLNWEFEIKTINIIKCLSLVVISSLIDLACGQSWQRLMSPGVRLSKAVTKHVSKGWEYIFKCIHNLFTQSEHIINANTHTRLIFLRLQWTTTKWFWWKCKAYCVL